MSGNGLRIGKAINRRVENLDSERILLISSKLKGKKPDQQFTEERLRTLLENVLKNISPKITLSKNSLEVNNPWGVQEKYSPRNHNK